MTINNILPERIDTDRQLQMANIAAKLQAISFEEARAQQVASIAAGRLGRPEEVGDACAYLCSVQAGFTFLDGNNRMLDEASLAGALGTVEVRPLSPMGGRR